VGFSSHSKRLHGLHTARVTGIANKPPASHSSNIVGYHLGVLKAAGLVNVDYERRSKETSKYRLTEEGEKVLEKLSRESKSKDTG